MGLPEREPRTCYNSFETSERQSRFAMGGSYSCCCCTDIITKTGHCSILEGVATLSDIVDVDVDVRCGFMIMDEVPNSR